MTTRIMVVDDEMLIRQLLTYQLSGAGYQVSAAQSGREALQQILTAQPDLILLDVMMQDMSGWDLCRQIRTYSNIPIILLTAKSTDDDVVTGLNAGADDYVTKPFSMVQLLARVEAVLRRNHTTRQAGSQKHVGQAYASARRNTDVPASVLNLENGSAPAPSRTDRLTPPRVSPAPLPARERLGRRFYEARKQRGLTLHQAEVLCGVRWEYLQALEQEHFGYMPRAQLRHALKAYSVLLELDLNELVGRQPRTQQHWSVSLAVAATFIMLLIVILSLQFF